MSKKPKTGASVIQAPRRRQYVVLRSERDEGVRLVARLYEGLKYDVLRVRSWSKVQPAANITRIALLSSGTSDIRQAAPASCAELAAFANRFSSVLLIGSPRRHPRMEKIEVHRNNQHLKKKAELAASWNVPSEASG